MEHINNGEDDKNICQVQSQFNGLCETIFYHLNDTFAKWLHLSADIEATILYCC